MKDPQTLTTSEGKRSEQTTINLAAGAIYIGHVEHLYQTINPALAQALQEEQNAAQTEVGKRGPKKQQLFAADKEKGKSSQNIVEAREAKRLAHCLQEHKLMSRSLNCQKDDALNETVVCFLETWRSQGLIPATPAGPAVWRFLTETCGLRSGVTEKSYGNHISELLRLKRWRVSTMKRVRQCFNS